MWGLNPDTTERRGIRGNGEERVSHGIEQGNDLTERVVTRRDRHSLVIAVSNHIRRIHVIEHSLGLLGSKQDSHGSDGWILVLVRIKPCERAVCGRALYKHEVVHDLSLFTII